MSLISMEMTKVLALLVALLGRNSLHILQTALIVQPSCTEFSGPGKTQVCVSSGTEEGTKVRRIE